MKTQREGMGRKGDDILTLVNMNRTHMYTTDFNSFKKCFYKTTSLTILTTSSKSGC